MTIYKVRNWKVIWTLCKRLAAEIEIQIHYIWPIPSTGNFIKILKRTIIKIQKVKVTTFAIVRESLCGKCPVQNLAQARPSRTTSCCVGIKYNVATHKRVAIGNHYTIISD
ncbi:hypothetical protein MARLIPOL_08329 [Marinobacter lipolyticus SM19]|uniref:Uncharacterized protein n=1 Tax=Marinobacter lipolyticus SM19 TaxID=1318628 RepID=R8B2D4_9GAMM|nr:hypothetical protein MARLIPOL_08329 [Marinobacter lipolyticus SM19]